MGVRDNAVTFETKLTVKEIGRTLQDVLARLKASSIKQISSGSGALEAFDDRADIQVVASGADFTALWAVQIYVVDRNNVREVMLVALGDSILSRAMGGARNTTSPSKSISKREK
jgi:hypothetical protein